MVSLVQYDLGPFRVNRFGDRYLINVNRERFDKLGAEVVFAQQFGKRLFNRDTFYIIVGTDSGLLPRYIARQGLPDGACYLFVEPAKILERVRDLLPAGQAADRMACVTPEQSVEAAVGLNISDHIFIDKVEILSTCAAEDMFWPEYREAGRVVRQSVNRYVWEVKSSLGFEVFIRRQLENLGENRVPATCLIDSFKGKTAVLLAGGPSLDDLLPWLLLHRDEVVVIAVSRVSRRLLEVGIHPDFVVSVDPNAASFDVSNEVLQFEGKSLLINGYHVCPLILGQWRWRSVYWGNAFPWASPLNCEKSITLGPTVTNLALDTAIEMGFAQVILAGVDLCFSRDGYTHAKASRERNIGARFSETDVQVETFGGWLADTTPAYANAVGELDAQARRARERGCRVVNSALGAARMASVTYVPLDELTVEPLNRSPAAVIAELLPEDSAATRCAHYREVLAELARADAALSRIRKLSTEALKVNKRLFNRGGSMNFKYRRRLEKIEEELEGTFAPFARLVKLFGIPSFLKVARPDSGRLPDKDELESVGRLYYQAYRDSGERLLTLTQEARQRIEARLAEESPAPDVPRLVSQWRKDRQPGRTLVWRRHHVAAAETLSREDEALLTVVASEFTQLLGNGYVGGTGTAEISVEIYDRFLSGAFARLIAAYRKKERSELERIIRILETHASAKAGPLLALARGYRAEFLGQGEEAIDRYQEALDEGDEHVQEEALRSIAFLSLQLQAMDNALLALRCLSGISPVYLPMYGDTLRAVGRAEEALEVYADYLDQVPEDQAAMLNLGCYYRELGITEGARMMFTHVLEHDPEHPVVRMLLAELD